jgi:flagellar hook-associated protein 1 FlgK
MAMAGDLTLALLSAQSGLLANQAALDSVANNIANVNSKGYSRKVTNLEQRVVAGAGAGVQLAEVTRVVDENLLKSLRLETSVLNELSVQSSFFDRLQDQFGTPDANTSISHTIAEFAKAIETLAVSPDKTLEQSDVIRWAQNITTKLHEMSRTIQELRLQADKAIGEAVTEINRLTQRIGSLNEDLVAFTTVNRDVSDLRDQRDQALDRLHELVDVRYFFRTDGDVVAFTAGGRTLVDNVPPTLTHNSAASVTATTTHAEGDFGGIFVGELIAGNDITTELRDGQLKGLVDLRDGVLPNLQSQLDELAAEMREILNQVHNRGMPFPGMQTATGTRIFIAPTTQTIRLDPTGSADDVAITLFNGSGDQQGTIRLNALMTSASFGSGAQPSRGPWTINEVASKLQSWFRANGASAASVSVNSAGNLAINLNAPSLNVAFRDETATTNGSTHEDAEIAFDANGDGVTDETVKGFSYFFGLNDFFVDNLADNVFESDVIASTFQATAATLTFRDSTGALTGSPLSVSAGESLQSIVTRINNTIPNVTAGLVPDGSGVRLRIAHDQGRSMTITMASGNTFLTDIGFHSADVGVSGSIIVRSDLAITPGRISRGAVQWNANLGPAGKYFASIGDNTIAKALGETLAQVRTFDVAGGLTGSSVSFDEFAAAILARNATLADNNKRDREFQKSLTDSLKLKSDSTRGVNLDEELSQLILFEQAYAAAARVVNVIQRMFDALDRAV